MQQPFSWLHCSPRSWQAAACVQLPDTHVKPVQHAFASSHALFWAMHVGGVLQTFDWHVSSSPSVQQASMSEHASPSSAHLAGTLHVNATQLRSLSEQHDTLGPQVAPFAAHVGGTVQTSLSHSSSPSVQQSLVVVHASSSSAQIVGSVHSSPSQTRLVQQSVLLLHALPASVHTAVHLPDWQLSDEQQLSAATVQLEPFARQVAGDDCSVCFEVLRGAHCPSTHVRPEQHLAEFVQGCADGLHAVTATHSPSTHSAPVQHARASSASHWPASAMHCEEASAGGSAPASISELELCVLARPVSVVLT